MHRRSSLRALYYRKAECSHNGNIIEALCHLPGMPQRWATVISIRSSNIKHFVFSLEHTQQFRSWLPFVVNQGRFRFLILSRDKTSRLSSRSLQCPGSSLARDANSFHRKSKLNSYTNWVGVKTAPVSSCQTQIIAREHTSTWCRTQASFPRP
jgi:hypothetical protein